MDLVRKFSNRPKLPYSVHQFSQFENADNCVTITCKGVPYAGIETFAFLLILEKLMELRPSYKEVFSDRIQIRKSDMIMYKSISEEDVWFSSAGILDDQSMVLNFLVLTFDVREQLKQFMEGEEAALAS